VEYLKPKKIEEAVTFAEKRDRSLYIAGGTDLSILFFDSKIKPEVLIDITDLEELKILEERKEGLYLGAAVLISQLANLKTIKWMPLCLAQGAGAIGSPQIRNLATLGGNICNASPCGDTLAPLVVLDAVFKLRSTQGIREVPVLDFFIGPKRTIRKEKELLEAVIIPKESLNGISGFFKTGKRKGQTISQVNSAVYIKKEGGRVSKIRIAAGSVAPTPIRLKKAEEAVIKGNLEEIESAVLEEIKPISDIRGSEEYRRIVTAKAIKEMVVILLKEDSRNEN